MKKKNLSNKSQEWAAECFWKKIEWDESKSDLD